MKKIGLLIIAAIAAVFMVATPVAALNDKQACEQMSSSDPNYDLICGNTSHTNADAQEEVGKILYTVFTIVSIIAVAVIIIGGIFYILSQGDPAKIQRAKAAILYAVIGLIVSLTAFAITNFVLRAAGGEI